MDQFVDVLNLKNLNLIDLIKIRKRCRLYKYIVSHHLTFALVARPDHRHMFKG